MLFDITQFDSYREDNRREIKKAKGGLPASLWDTINNRNKISANLLTDKDVESYEDENGKLIMVIHVPVAKREQKPIYINDDMFNSTFRRDWEGDYHCERREILAMLRDEPEETMDIW